MIKIFLYLLFIFIFYVLNLNLNNMRYLKYFFYKIRNVFVSIGVMFFIICTFIKNLIKKLKGSGCKLRRGEE